MPPDSSSSPPGAEDPTNQSFIAEIENVFREYGHRDRIRFETEEEREEEAKDPIREKEKLLAQRIFDERGLTREQVSELGLSPESAQRAKRRILIDRMEWCIQTNHPFPMGILDLVDLPNKEVQTIAYAAMVRALKNHTITSLNAAIQMQQIFDIKMTPELNDIVINGLYQRGEEYARKLEKAFGITSTPLMRWCRSARPHDGLDIDLLLNIEKSPLVIGVRDGTIPKVEGLIKAMKEYNSDDYAELRNSFIDRHDVEGRETDIIAGLRAASLEHLAKDNPHRAIAMLDELKIFQPDILEDAQVHAAAMSLVENYGRKYAASGDRNGTCFYAIDNLLTKEQKQEARVKEIRREILIARLTDQNFKLFECIGFEDSFDYKTDKEVAQAAMKRMKFALVYFDSVEAFESGLKDIEALQNLVAVDEESVQSIIREAVLLKVDLGLARVFEKHPAIPHALSAYTKELEFHPYLHGLVENWGFTTIEELADFSARNNRYFEFLRKTPSMPAMLTADDRALLERYHLTLLEGEQIRRSIDNGLMEMLPVTFNEETRKSEKIEDPFGTGEEACVRNLFAYLVSYTEEWSDEHNIANPFRSGAKLFGFKRMFAYIARPGLSRHDALHHFDWICEAQKHSGLTADQFFHNILSQVMKDDGGYDEGTAHHVLNAIVYTRQFDPSKTLQRAADYRQIEGLQELARSFREPKDVFGSWNNLKRYVRLTTLLGQQEILGRLAEVKKEGKLNLYRYVETIAFHPHSKVNMDAVIEFCLQPEKFFDRGDSHAPLDIHERKKPSNYFTFPHLDLTPENLRDAIAETGTLDRLQALRPLEIRYRFPKGEPETLRSLIGRALGSQKEGRAPQARQHRKLFAALNGILKAQSPSLDIPSYLKGDAALPPEVASELQRIVLDPAYAVPRQPAYVVIAKIVKKSDPEGSLAGNDTACCMPFESGKNIVYDANPGCAKFLLQIETGDGKLRTIAQSVMTKDKDVGKLISDVVKELGTEENLAKVIPPAVLDDALDYPVADNVEVATNFKQEPYMNLIERAYRDFFAEYVRRFAVADRLHPERLYIGKGYSDALQHLPEVPNTFAPVAPPSYSDNMHPKVYVLDLKAEPAVDRKIVEIEQPKRRANISIETPNVQYLDFHDTLAAAYLEGKAYEDNPSLMVYLSNLENGLIAKDINNELKDRPNMSLKYVDDKGRIRGYLLAYEGKFRGHDTEGQGGTENEDILYILDLAADPDSARAGGSLIKSFVDLYAKNYLRGGKPIPVYCEARETTSFRIIQRQLEKTGAKLGITFTLEELPTYKKGEDTMHPIFIRPTILGDQKKEQL